MSDADGPLDSLADSILDGLTVDWSSLDERLQSDPDLLAQLRTVATVKRLLWNGGATPSLTTWGHLTIRERIGRGSFGEVYRAWDPQLDREVALKLLVPGDTATPGALSVIEEGRLLARIRHPNVVTIYGAERIDGCVGLWMELVKGRTLEELIVAGRRFTVEEATSIGGEVCGAVAAVHDAGLLHRDIKAHNVMLTEEARSVLMDFGTGREADPTPDATEAGTPLYLAPEVLSGCTATVRSDVYSIGVLLYHLLTGSYPLPARSVEELRRAHAEGARQSLRSARPDVRSRLARVIERAIDPDPLRRFDDASALAAALTTARKPSLLRRSVPAAAVAAALIAGPWVWRDTPVPRPEPRILAVLPFEHLRPNPENDYLADGLTEEIIRTLSTIDGMQVRPLTSSLSFKNGPRSPGEVGQRLGVDHVVEGTFERDRNRLRVNMRLVHVAGGAPLWSQTFDRTLDEIFGLQDDISRGIAGGLQLTVEERPPRRQPGIAAYEAYLRARAHIERGGTANAKKGAALLEQVIARDPFAAAYASLVDAYWFMSTELRTPLHPDALLPVDALALMRPLAAKAIELDPLLAEAHSAMGMTLSRECDWTSASRSFRQAIELNPALTNTYTNYSTATLVPLGRFAEAERLLNVALRNDPLSAAVHQELGVLQLVMGRYDAAAASFQQAIDFNSNLRFAEIFLAEALTFSGRLAEAWAIWEKRRHRPGWQFWIAHWYVRAGQRPEAERLLETHEHPFRRAIIYAALGDADRTIEALNFAADVYPHRVAITLRLPELAFLRGDPKLEPLRRKLKLP